MSAHRARRGMLVAVVALAGFALPATAPADTITQWNEIAANALIRDAGQGAVSTAHLAMVHGAMYDAVNAIDRRYEPYVYTPRAPRWYSQDAAAAAAAYRVLVGSDPAVVPVVPVDQVAAMTAKLTPLYDAALAAIADGPAKAGGIATGIAAADAMIYARKRDGRFGPFRFTPGDTVGVWRVEPPNGNDPGAWLKDVKPFLVEDGSQFAARPPDELTSRRYARDFNEVKTVGALNSTTRTQDQTDAGRFWGAANATGTWGALLRSIADGHPAPLADHARLFARVYLASADALITVWNDKARYTSWRPITAIHQGDQDGNPDTAGDPAWLPLVANPPYPEYPSGLTAFGVTATRTLDDFYGTDDATFGATNAASPGVSRSYTSFSQASSEIIDARVWSGIHFRNADDASARIGRRVARYAERFFGPLHGGHEAQDDGDADDEVQR